MSYNSEVIADSPIAYWRFGEASGNPQDSVGTNHVTVVNGAPIYGVAGALAGDGDTAISLGPASMSFTAPDVTALDLGNVFSIEFWVKRTRTDYEPVLDKGNTGGDAYVVYFTSIASDNRLRLAASGAGTAIVESTVVITDTVWHHAVITKNGSTRAVYLDGVDRTSLLTDATLTNTTNALILGNDRFNSGSYETLDEIALYSYALTAARVLAHYRAGVAQPARLDYSLFPKFLLRRVA